MHYLPLTPTDRKEMLAAIGVNTCEDLLAGIPQSLRDVSLSLPEPLSELELKRHMTALAARNASTQTVNSFLGAGAYEHFIPAAVDHIISRSEFYTAYTPYQSEASQGTLQAIYEYQSMICSLTGMDVANASHYDGATSTAEAVILAAGVTRRNTVLIARTVHPEYRAVLETYLHGTALCIKEIPYAADGSINSDALDDALTDSVACVVAQTPNFFGIVEDFTAIEKTIHAQNALFIMIANPLSLSVFKSPGEWGADIACGDAQVFGNPLSFGGPYLGYFATKAKYMRKIPGRLVGVTRDQDERRVFTLTLQAREQHIRRAKASSNICSNQALCALAAAVHVALMGKKGLVSVGRTNIRNATTLCAQLTALTGCRTPFTGTIFNEFVLTVPGDSSVVLAHLSERGIVGGVPLAKWYPELKNSILVCATEMKTNDDIARYSAVMSECCMAAKVTNE